MNTASQCLAYGLMALGASHFSIAMAGEPQQNPSNECYWRTAPGMKDFRRDIGALYVARDAKIGSVIGSVNMSAITPDPAGLEVACINDGTALLEFRAVATVPVFPGVIDPINGEDVTGKILQTNIPGVGVRTRLGIPLTPSRWPVQQLFHPCGRRPDSALPWHSRSSANDKRYEDSAPET